MKYISALLMLSMLIGCTMSANENPPQLTITPIVGTSTGVTGTFVSGPSSTILIDTQMTPPEGNALVEHIRETGKPLTAIYITHAHLDHALALDILTAAYPDARLLATPSVAEAVNQLYPQWKQQFGEDPETSLARPDFVFEVVGDSINVDGVELEIVPALQGDTPDNTAVWIPSQSTLIGGDILFNQVHLFFVETPASEDRARWLAEIDRLEALNAEIIIPGHILPNLSFDNTTYDFTREYISLFDQAINSDMTAEEVVATIKAHFPSADPGSEFLLEMSANALKGEP